jgi:N-methylhydantoinase B/oxoprolinase/acetone carboxylase alpha subunit
MAYTWEIQDIDRNQQTHAYTVVFKEIDTVSGQFWIYRITKPPGTAKAVYLADLKAQVNAARTIRNQIEAIRASIDPAALEAYINS